MRVLLLIAAITYTCQALGCCHGAPSISEAFHHSDVVFYGKYIKKKVSDYFLSNGRPVTIDNFQVIRLYKGGDTSLLEDVSKQYFISLTSSCDDYTFSPRCFEPNHYYLIYATNNPFTGMLGIDDCARYREIKDGEFTTTPLDFGEYWIKDEQAELLKFAQLKKAPTWQARSYTTIMDEKHQEIRAIKRELTSLNSVLFRYKLAVYGLFAVLFLEVLGLRLRKKRSVI